MSAIYAWTLIGPMSLLGLLVILLFYPIMVSFNISLIHTTFL